jgi:hypothetical protein
MSVRCDVKITILVRLITILARLITDLARLITILARLITFPLDTKSIILVLPHMVAPIIQAPCSGRIWLLQRFVMNSVLSRRLGITTGFPAIGDGKVAATYG